MMKGLFDKIFKKIKNMDETLRFVVISILSTLLISAIVAIKTDIKVFILMILFFIIGILMSAALHLFAQLILCIYEKAKEKKQK